MRVFSGGFGEKARLGSATRGCRRKLSQVKGKTVRVKKEYSNENTVKGGRAGQRPNSLVPAFVPGIPPGQRTAMKTDRCMGGARDVVRRHIPLPHTPNTPPNTHPIPLSVARVRAAGQQLPGPAWPPRPRHRPRQ